MIGQRIAHLFFPVFFLFPDSIEADISVQCQDILWTVFRFCTVFPGSPTGETIPFPFKPALLDRNFGSFCARCLKVCLFLFLARNIGVIGQCYLFLLFPLRIQVYISIWHSPGLSRLQQFFLLLRRQAPSKKLVSIIPEEILIQEDRRTFPAPCLAVRIDRKSTRLNSSHVSISYAVFCLKKKIKNISAII